MQLLFILFEPSRERLSILVQKLYDREVFVPRMIIVIYSPPRTPAHVRGDRKSYLIVDRGNDTRAVRQALF